MAQRIIRTVTCDRHEARGENVEATHESVPLVVGKSRRELDLCDPCRSELDAALEDFLSASRKASQPDPTERPSKQGSRRLRAVGTAAPQGQSVTRTEVAATGESKAALIRSWAAQNGHTVSDRGRIPAEVRQAYAEAHEPTTTAQA